MVEMAENEGVLSDSELTAAIEMRRASISDEELELLAPTGPATVYTTAIRPQQDWFAALPNAYRRSR